MTTAPLLIGTIAGLNKIDPTFHVSEANEIHNNQTFRTAVS